MASSSRPKSVPHVARLALLAALLLACPRPSAAETATPDSAATGRIHGRGLSPDGPERFANVIILGTRRGATTDSLGTFVITLIPPGQFIMRVIALEFEPVNVGVTVRAGHDTSIVVNVPLRPRHRAHETLVATCDSTRALWGRRGEFADIAAVDTSGWLTASGSIFDFSLPPSFRRQHVHGIDSEVASWRADSVLVTYDLG